MKVSCLVIGFLLIVTVHYSHGSAMDSYERIKLRRARSHQPNEDDLSSALKTPVVDPVLLSELGSVKFGSGLIDRKRRDQWNVNKHGKKAETDAIAAAAEAAAAEADAVAAALEEAEADEDRRNYNNNEDIDGISTFEESDDGSNMVAVEDDPREIEHTRKTGNQKDTHSSVPKKHPSHKHAVKFHTDTRELDTEVNNESEDSAQPAEFDVQHEEEEQNTNDVDNNENGNEEVQINGSNEQMNSETIENADASGIDVGSYSDVKSPLNALLSESSTLAKEIRLIFEVLAKREDYLVKEMDQLKVALQNAIQELEEDNERVIRVRREDSDNSKPYKACVYIQPPVQKIMMPPGQITHQSVTEPPLPPEEPMYDYDLPETGALTGNSDVDLSNVYWLKLPENDDEGILERVHGILSDTRDKGKDILMIPVTGGYTSSEDIAKGFLKAVKVNPSKKRDLTGKRRFKRKKLRLRIRRI